MYYTPTPDYYNDILKHGMQERSEDTLTHYGVKGMKWRKHLKGKAQLLKTKVNRKLRGMSADQISNGYGKYNIYGPYNNKLINKDHGKAVSTSLPTGNWSNQSERKRLTGAYNEEEFMGKKVNPSGFHQDPTYVNVNGKKIRTFEIDPHYGIEAGRERAKKRKKN